MNDPKSWNNQPPILEDILKILTPFLSVIPVIGGALKESTEKIIDFSKKALDHFSNSKNTEVDVIEEYLKSFTTSKGGIYEENFYTRLITCLVERFKFVDAENDNPKQTVLIIDDLDRIDPEHIFRILNVFAAHRDTITQGNKFGFDKVVVVCDINNIRNIFHHKYGANTDFNGYIDKFYSVDVFRYSMMDELYEEVDSILNTIRGNAVLDQLFELRRNRNELFSTLQKLLRSFVKFGIINVRNIVSLKGNKYVLNTYDFYSQEQYINTHFWGLAIFNFLKTIFGDYYEVLVAFEKYRKSLEIDTDLNYNEWVLNYLLLPLHCIEVKETTIEVPIINKEDGIRINVKLESIPPIHARGYHANVDGSQNTNWEEIKHNCNFNEFFYQTYKLAFEKQYLK